MPLHQLAKNAAAARSEGGNLKPETGPDAAMASSIGRVLRELRKHRDLSLGDLSAAAGVSSSMLSQIENGRSTPTVAVLWKIAHSLDVPLQRFLEDFESAGQVSLLRYRDAPARISHPGQTVWRNLAEPHSAHRLGFFEITVRAESTEDVPPAPDRGWCRLHLASGQLLVGLAGRRYGLAPGDTLHYRSDLSHSLINPAGDDARAFLVVSRGPDGAA